MFFQPFTLWKTQLKKVNFEKKFQFDEDTKQNSSIFRPALNIRRMKTSLEDCIEVIRILFHVVLVYYTSLVFANDFNF
jgi:hypothetical protein